MEINGVQSYLKFRAESAEMMGHKDPMARYLTDNGKTFTHSECLTEEQQDLVETMCIAFEPQAKQCFFNAQYMSLMSSAQLGERLKYCEGFFCRKGGIPVHHAWLTLDGKLIDVTLTTNEYTVEQLTAFMEDGEELPREDNLSDCILGVIPDGWEYFGVEFDAKKVAQDFMEREKSFSVIDDWEGGFPVLKPYL